MRVRNPRGKGEVNQDSFIVNCWTGKIVKVESKMGSDFHRIL